MKTKITQDQINRYRHDGFLILEQFLEDGELHHIRDAVTDAVAGMGRRKVAGEGNAKLVEGETYNDRVFFQRINLWKINDTIKGLFLDAALGEMLCRLAGVNGIRVWHDQLLQKEAWANPTVFHLDNPYWSFHSPNAISIWIALDDATVQNGCMYFLPGTHKMTTYDNVPPSGNISDLFAVCPDFAELEAVVATMKAGMASVHNGLLAHAAGPNMTPYPRRAMTCAYMPDGSTFNGQQNILSDDQLARLKVGDLLDDESQNPLVWSGEKEVNAN